MANSNENTIGGVSPNYDRKKYNDPKKIDEFRKNTFGDRKTQQDSYESRNIVHSSQSAAKRKYGENASSKHVGVVDHVVSVKKVHEKLKNIPYLDDENIKEIANIDSNMTITSQKTNAKKGNKSNTAFVLKEKNLTTDSKKNLINAEIKAEVAVNTHAVIKTTQNVGNEFARGAVHSLEAATIPLVVEGVNNIILVANGEKDFEDALTDMGKLTTQVAVSGGIIQTVTTGLTNSMKNSGIQVFSKIANSNQVTQIITVALIVKDSAFKFLNGEIDGKQFFLEIGEKGVQILSGTIGYMTGQLLIPIPIVGGLIGSFVISTVCGEIYRIFRTLNDYKEKERYVTEIAEQALCEMKYQQDILKSIIKKEFSQMDKLVDEGFSDIANGTLNDNIDMLAMGFEKIANAYGKSTAFESYEEFESFFADENAVFVF